MATEREAAFYYPGVIWRDPNWVKSLALFFDEVALLVPDYMRRRPHSLDPAIAEGLDQAGLLRILSPEELIDQAASEMLASSIADVLARGALDDLPNAGPFQELSWSRMGGFGDEALARMLFEELQERGLAQNSEDGVSVPLHPVVRSLFLVLLAQILREAGPRVGLELSPATDRPQIQNALGACPCNGDRSEIGRFQGYKNVSEGPRRPGEWLTERHVSPSTITDPRS